MSKAKKPVKVTKKTSHKKTKHSKSFNFQMLWNEYRNYTLVVLIIVAVTGLYAVNMPKDSTTSYTASNDGQNALNTSSEALDSDSAQKQVEQETVAADTTSPATSKPQQQSTPQNQPSVAPGDIPTDVCNYGTPPRISTVSTQILYTAWKQPATITVTSGTGNPLRLVEFQGAAIGHPATMSFEPNAPSYTFSVAPADDIVLLLGYTYQNLPAVGQKLVYPDNYVAIDCGKGQPGRIPSNITITYTITQADIDNIVEKTGPPKNIVAN